MMVEFLLFPGALLPLVVVGTLLVGLLWPATRAMPVAWLSAVLVGYFLWEMPLDWLAAASVSGVLTAVEILWIVFGALVLLYTMMRAGAVDRINAGLVFLSEDRRVQVLLLGFFLATFLEGVAGFGTPAAVVAPLLFALGFPPLAAVVSALVGHSVATMFGAVGTPVVVGISTALDSVSGELEAAGLTVIEFTDLVTLWGAVYQSFVGLFMPLIVVGMVVYCFGDSDARPGGDLREVVPLCLYSGVCFVVPFVATALLVGPELPSVIGSMVGGGIVVVTLRIGYLLPDSSWTFPDRETWPDRWTGSVDVHTTEPVPDDGSPPVESAFSASPVIQGSSPSPLKAWAPYALLVLLLVLTRTVDPIRHALNRWAWFVLPWQEIFGTGIGETVRWAYVPGTWLLVSALLAIPLYGMSTSDVLGAWREAGRKLLTPAVALGFVIAMVTVMLESGQHPGAPGSGSMMVVLAAGTASSVGEAYPFVASLIGVLGTFITGSITVSNLTFGAFQYEVAGLLSISAHQVVAAQMVGASVGNTLAVHNVIAALATVGLVGQEGRVIRLNLFPVGFVVLLLAGLLLVVL